MHSGPCRSGWETRARMRMNARTGMGLIGLVIGLVSLSSAKPRLMGLKIIAVGSGQLFLQQIKT